MKAILFDVDGTLLDTSEYIYQSFEYSLKKHYKPLKRDQIGTIMGKPLEECYQILTTKDDVSDLAQSHNDFQKENPHLSFPFPNTLKVLRTLKDKNYHKALDFFGVEPKQAIMVGDSPVDILAGKNAGVKTVGVTYGFHGDRIIESDPDHVIDDIAEVLDLV